MYKYVFVFVGYVKVANNFKRTIVEKWYHLSVKSFCMRVSIQNLKVHSS